jgi:hypothetical protein
VGVDEHVRIDSQRLECDRSNRTIVQSQNLHHVHNFKEQVISLALKSGEAKNNSEQGRR